MWHLFLRLGLWTHERGAFLPFSWSPPPPLPLQAHHVRTNSVKFKICSPPFSLLQVIGDIKVAMHKYLWIGAMDCVTMHLMLISFTICPQGILEWKFPTNLYCRLTNLRITVVTAYLKDSKLNFYRPVAVMHYQYLCREISLQLAEKSGAALQFSFQNSLMENVFLCGYQLSYG